MARHRRSCGTAAALLALAALVGVSLPTSAHADVRGPDAARSFGGHAVTRAQSWVDAHVRYNSGHMYTNEYGTYRQDCSGYVSMSWALDSSYTTATLPAIAHHINKSMLRRGDVLLHRATSGSGHVVLFDHWTDAAQTSYVAYEESPSSGAVHHTLPYPYWDGNGVYRPFRKDAP